MCSVSSRQPQHRKQPGRAAHLWVVIKSHAHAHRALSVIAQKILNVDERSMVGEPVSVCLELCVAGISAVPNMGLVMRRC